MPSLPTRIDRFEIKRLIGRGGMGELYLAHDPNTGRLVAIKVLSATEDSPELRARFVREARALAALNHPNIVRIYDSGEFEGSPFIVMEYVRGETLETVIRRRAPLSVHAKLSLLIELCVGLAEAHARGIVHRDLKPANLIVDDQGRLRILDFGIARVIGDHRSAGAVPLTQVNVALGTPGYMAPEQIQGRPVDHRADVFAAGAVCYELLAYRPAFPGSTLEEIERGVLSGAPAPLAPLLPEIGDEIDEIVRAALARDPAERIQDAKALEEALTRARARAGRAPATEGTPATEVGGPLPMMQTEVGGPVPGSTAIGAPPPTTADAGAAAQPIKPPNKRWRSVRAEAAYRRALDAQRSGAIDAARRFAAEAVAEDPTYADARELLAQLSARPGAQAADGLLPPTVVPTRAGDTTSGPSSAAAPTIVGSWGADTRGAGGSAPTIIVDAPGSRGPMHDTRTVATAGPGGSGWLGRLSRQQRHGGGRDLGAPDEPVWVRYRGLLLAAGLLVLLVLIGGASWLVFRSVSPSGFTLTLERPVNGTVTGAGLECGTRRGDCVVTRPGDEVVQLVPEPDPGYAFDHYTGDCAPNGEFRMTGPRTCGAVFVQAGDTGVPAASEVVLTISPVPTEGTLVGTDIRCGTTGTVCSARYKDGEDVQLRPFADEGFIFAGFTGACSAAGKVTMSGPQTCGATFARVTASATTSQPVVVPSKPKGGGKAGESSLTSVTTSQPGTPNQPGTQSGSAPPSGSDTPATETKEPPKDPETDEQFAKRKILELLALWCDAHEKLDAEALHRLQPTANIDALRIQLNPRAVTSIQCTFSEPKYVSIEPGPGRATVQVELKRVYQHAHANSKKNVVEQIATFAVSRPGERLQWRVESVTYKPK